MGIHERLQFVFIRVHSWSKNCPACVAMILLRHGSERKKEH